MMNARLEELRIKFQENPRRYFAPFANELRKTGDTAQAIAICRTHLAGQPGHVSGHIVLGQALYEAGESAEAREVFMTALDLDPENLIALRTMGEMAQVGGDFSGARHWYERLLDADPRNSDAAQLIRDLPADGATPASSFAPPAEAASEAEAPPAEPATTAPSESSAAEQPPTTAPSGFHTTYTGVAAAYAPREPWTGGPPAEPPVAPEVSATELPDFESEAAEPEAPAAEFETTAPSPVGVPEALDQTAGELDLDDGTSPTDRDAMDVEEAAAPPVPAPFDAAELDLEISIDHEPIEAREAHEEFPAGEPEEAGEPPRALFAEHGFDADENSRSAWMTPSAAYSDPEAAPEPDDWFEAASEPADSEEAGARAEAAPQATAPDSWFDEPPAMPEAAEETAEEYWMPDFAGVQGAATDDAALASAEAFASHGEGEPALASGETMPPAGEPHRVEVEAMEDLAVESLVIEHPPAESAPPAVELAVAAHGEVPVAESVASAPDEPAEAPASEYPDPAIGHTPSFTQAVPVSGPAPAPFVTETLAELYLQQGFREEALAIYRQLADRDPNDQILRARIAAIEAGAASDVMQAAEAPKVPQPTVRAFFSRLAHRAPSRPVAADAPPAPDVPFAAAASALANLFAASRPVPADEGAAATLSSAFTDPAGRPSGSDDRELSLDHLFRDVPAGGSAAGELRLDEFYTATAPSAQPGAPTTTGPGSTAPEAEGTDIRQFTAWLEGLRKK